VFAGNSFSATETVPTNWQLLSATCSNGSGSLSGGVLSSISVAADEDVTCTFTNKLNLGAIKVTKTSTKGNAPLAGAVFDVSKGGSTVATLTTGNDGTDCVANLAFGDYSVKETSAPTGYKINDTTTSTVTVNAVGTCTTGTQATKAYSDTPLSEIEVKFRSLAGAGVTKASIDCGTSAVSENGAADPAFDDTDETFTNLTPGTYTCTVVVDP
jgi:uncharacterized surface anchored protein